MKSKQKVLLIDGHNFLFRGYYGVPPAAKMADGTSINAVYGFFSLLRNTLKEIDPNYIIVIFDSETSISQKREVRPEYKANRPLNNGDVYVQLPLIKKSLELMKISWIDDKKFEADDLIGTYVELFKKKKILSFIASSDYDFMQLISKKVLVVRGRHGSVDIYDEKKVFSTFGILPIQYLDYLALVGDSSDNIKGIKGIGKKRASNLLSKHKNIINTYRDFDSLPQTSQKLLKGHEVSLINQKKFLQINMNIDLQSEFKIKNYLFLTNTLPEKMGEFLNKNWKKII